MDGESSIESKLSRDSIADSGRMYAKLRRLKIQEEILTASINKNPVKCDIVDSERCFSNDNMDLRIFINTIKRTFSEIKVLFEDVKIITKDQNNLKNTDIDDIKKDIFELDKKIKSFKDFINKESCILKVAEKEILLQIHRKSDESKYMKLPIKTHTKPNYNEVVPSPVRAIIKSPFKCIEVQRFQEFMKNSCNRYGGWNEYNHNIFVNIWNKHNNNEEIFEVPSFLDGTYVRFQEEVLQKIIGVNPEDVRSHTQWYIEYMNLKRCQELALFKWKENKRKIKNPTQIRKEKHSDINNKTTKPFNPLCKKEINSRVERNVNKNHFQADELHMDKLFQSLSMGDSSTETLDLNFILDNTSDLKVHNIEPNYYENKVKQERFSTLYKTTKQWQNRCQGKNDSITTYNVNDIKKLKIPMWRIDLK